MLPATVTKCCPHMAQLCGFAASDLKNILDCAKAMKTETDTLPDDLKLYGEVMTEFSMKVLIGSYVERLQLMSEEITRAALPPEQQTKKSH